jgi:hypothetical protein
MPNISRRIGPVRLARIDGQWTIRPTVASHFARRGRHVADPSLSWKPARVPTKGISMYLCGVHDPASRPERQDMSENPFSTELPALLTHVLLSIEGLRRDPDPSEADWRETEEELETFASQQATLVPRDIAADVQTAVDEARAALGRRELEKARQALIGVGRILDSWLRNER